jgi:hypothetical protein
MKARNRWVKPFVFVTLPMFLLVLVILVARLGQLC